MKKVLILLVLPLLFICCTNKKQYNIDDLTILVSNPSKPNKAYHDTISTHEFFDAMLKPPKQTNLLSNSWLTHVRFPLPNQFDPFMNFPNASSFRESEYLFIEKSSNQKITGNVFFSYFTLETSCLFEDKINFIGLVENGKMIGKWKIPLQLAPISIYKDFLPSSPHMFFDFPIGLITINYKNGLRHGRTSITDVKGYEFYTCNYYQGKLHGDEKLEFISAENAHIAWSGLGVWGLNNYSGHWADRLLPKQIIKYRHGEIIKMQIWAYDMLELKSCIGNLNAKDIDKSTVSMDQPTNFQELKKYQIDNKKKYAVFENCLKLNLILNWNIDSKNSLKDVIIQSFKMKKETL